jgi:hypothetical protein
MNGRFAPRAVVRFSASVTNRPRDQYVKRHGATAKDILRGDRRAADKAASDQSFTFQTIEDILRDAGVRTNNLCIACRISIFGEW